MFKNRPFLNIVRNRRSENVHFGHFGHSILESDVQGAARAAQTPCLNQSRFGNLHQLIQRPSKRNPAEAGFSLLGLGDPNRELRITIHESLGYAMASPDFRSRRARVEVLPGGAFRVGS